MNEDIKELLISMFSGFVGAWTVVLAFGACMGLGYLGIQLSHAHPIAAFSLGVSGLGLLFGAFSRPI